jgi:hypothetical protein
MALSTIGPYPLTPEMTDDYAVVHLRAPYPRTWELVGDELVAAARDHAREWETFAGTLAALLRSGWSIQGPGGLYATRAANVSELLSLITLDLEHGMFVEWCTADENGGLFAIGGVVAGYEPPAATFPGSSLPALIENDLTGAQRLVDTEDELRAAVREELRACASWWRQHPEERSDHDAHGLPDELDELAAGMETGPVPATVADADASPLGAFRGNPSTRLQVYPVSAVVFTGLMEAANSYHTLTNASREGLAMELRKRGAAVARELGLVQPTA